MAEPLLREATNLRRERDEARADLRALREAVGPFADMARVLLGSEGPDDIVDTLPDSAILWREEGKWCLTYGDLRRLRRAGGGEVMGLTHYPCGHKNKGCVDCNTAALRAEVKRLEEGLWEALNILTCYRSGHAGKVAREMRDAGLTYRGENCHCGNCERVLALEAPALLAKPEGGQEGDGA